MAESDALPEPQKKQQQSPTRWSTAKVVATTLLTIIGTVASVIGVVQILTRDTTDFSSLRISAEVMASGRTDWAVPAALLEELPANSQGCDPDLSRWLEENAQRLDRHLMLTVSNVAREGSMLALTQLRSDVEVSSERGDIHILLICDPEGVVADRIHYGRVDADSPSTPGRLVTLEYGRPPRTTAEVPITYNLAPGESGQLVIELFSKYPAVGTLTASVLHREEIQVIDIPDTDFQLPSLLFAGDMYLVTGEQGLVCRRARAGSLSECDVSDVQTEVARAER